MRRYLAFLRAINVGGHRVIRMADLKKTFGSLGFENVVTYIQSGNVFFSCDQSDPMKLEEAIGRAIRDEYGFDVAVMVRTADELFRVVEQNPFKDLDENLYKIYVALLVKHPCAQDAAALSSQSNQHESFVVNGNHVFISVDGTFKGKVAFSNSFIEKQLKVDATIRNIRVTRRLAELFAESST